MSLIAAQGLAGIAVEAELSGYFKYAENDGEIYLDERALFVEKVTILG